MVKRVPEKLKKVRKTKENEFKNDKMKRKIINNEIRKRWYHYQKEWKKKDRIIKKKREIAKVTGTFFLATEPQVALVIRIRGINRMNPKLRKILRLFRLRQLHNAVLIKLNKATKGMLNLIEPYIAYGYPTVSTIKKLICKRGFLKINNQRIPLMNNDQIEKKLGHLDIKSIACIINELYTCGPNFTIILRSLWPFKLNSPKGGYRGKKRKHFIEGGTYGNHENYINNLTNKMI